MKKARTRVILAVTFLALVQIACGCEVNHEVAAHIYQDLNGNRVQDSDEPDFPGIEVSSDKDQRYLKTKIVAMSRLGVSPLKTVLIIGQECLSPLATQEQKTTEALPAGISPRFC